MKFPILALAASVAFASLGNSDELGFGTSHRGLKLLSAPEDDLRVRDSLTQALRDTVEGQAGTIRLQFTRSYSQRGGLEPPAPFSVQGSRIAWPNVAIERFRTRSRQEAMWLASWTPPVSSNSTFSEVRGTSVLVVSTTLDLAPNELATIRQIVWGKNSKHPDFLRRVKGLEVYHVFTGGTQDEAPFPIHRTAAERIEAGPADRVTQLGTVLRVATPDMIYTLEKTSAGVASGRYTSLRSEFEMEDYAGILSLPTEKVASGQDLGFAGILGAPEALQPAPLRPLRPEDLLAQAELLYAAAKTVQLAGGKHRRAVEAARAFDEAAKGMGATPLERTNHLIYLRGKIQSVVITLDMAGLADPEIEALEEELALRTQALRSTLLGR